MRIFLILSVIIISVNYGSCRIDLKRDKEVIIDIDSPELHQSQYHTADFDTSAYNYGYAVEPNGQFHHETRGGDGVTYGCYGYIDSDDLLKVTHYVADSQGYRTLEHEKPVLVYPIDENVVDPYEKPYKPKGVMLDWKDLYFPIGCGMAKGGVLLNAPVIRAPGGNFKQLGETIYPVQPSHEPKVVVPQIPLNIGIKTEPTKLIPISTSSTQFSSTKGVNPSTGASQGPTVRPSVSTNGPSRTGSTYNPSGFGETVPLASQGPAVKPSVSTNGPSRTGSTRNPSGFGETVPPASKGPTVRPSVLTNGPSRTGSTRNPSGFGETVSPVPISQFRESINVNGPSTLKAPSDNLKLHKVAVPVNPEVVNGVHDDNDSLLPPFRTTNLFETQTTISVPFSNNPDDDLNIINAYVNTNPESPITTQSDYIEEITTAVPTPSQAFSIFNNNRPITFSAARISTIRPNQFLGFNFNTPTTTETPNEFATDENPDSTTFLSTETESISSPFVESLSFTKQPSKDTTSVKSNTARQETRFGVSSSIASQRPAVESSTSPPPNVLEFETTTSQSTYPGIGDYKKPQSGFEFNIPTRTPIQVTTDNVQTFVTNINVETETDNAVNPKGVYGIYVQNKEPYHDNDEKLTKFTNGPHGAEYQLGSRNPHSQFTVSSGRDNNYNSVNPIKQSRKEEETKDPSIPMTHLSMSGSYPSRSAVTVSSTQTDNFTNQPTQFVINHSTDKQSSPSPTTSNSFNAFDPSLQVVNPYRQNTIQSVHEPNRSKPQQPSGFPTITTPKNEPSLGIITHMNAISQTRIQPNRGTPSLTAITPSYEERPINPPYNYRTPAVPESIRLDVTPTTRPELIKSTDYPFLYTRSRVLSDTENISYQRGLSVPSPSPDLITKTPIEELNIYSGFGQKIKPGTNAATTSFTAYSQGPTSSVPESDLITPSTDTSYKPASFDNSGPKFVLRPTVNSNRQPSFLGYPENQNANFYPDVTQQKSIAFGDKNNNIQTENKYVNSKKEFVPQYNPNSTPIPGSLGTAIGVYPPNIDELSPEIPNFNIAISKWPFYILPFPFTNGNLMSFPFIGGMPFQLGATNNIPLPNTNTGNEYSNGVSGVGNGQPAQTICSWLSSFIKPKENNTNTETEKTNGETLQISNLQVNIKNPELNHQVPFGIVGFIPIIAIPNCQHNINGGDSASSPLPSSIQIPSLCSQLSHLIGSQINPKDTNQPLAT